MARIDGLTPAGDPVVMEVLPRRQKAGFADGRHWMLPIDKATGRIKFELGRKGRKFYVTKRPRNDPSGKGGYTKQDIATETGLPLATITDAWIIASTIYGRSADKPLEMDTGFAVWGAATNNISGTNSFKGDQLFLERGYNYRDGAWSNGMNYISRAASGEGPLHPILVSSYGVGAAPVIDRMVASFQNTTNANWFAFQDVDVDLVRFVSPFEVILSHVEARGPVASGASGTFSFEGGGHRTLYRCKSINASTEPIPGATVWSSPSSHVVGIYGSALKSLLVLETFVEQAGWRDGYNPNSDSTQFPMPHNQKSHGAYLQNDFHSVSIRRSMFTRSSSLGVQMRGGGTLEDTLLLDQNVVMNSLGRSKVNGVIDVSGSGNYPLVMGLVATSAAYKRSAAIEGGLDWGIDMWASFDGSIFNSILMHRADPNNATEIAAKPPSGEPAFKVETNGHDRSGLRIHNWYGPQNNAAQFGVSAVTLDAITIQRHAAAAMGVSSATIEQYCLWLRTLTPAQLQDRLAAVLEYFRTPWGLHIPRRVNASTCVFKPDPRCSGVLWAERANWSTHDTAGTIDGDSAELRGVAVRFGELTVSMAAVDGQGGSLELSSGKLTTASLSNLSQVKTILAGQIWIGAQTAVGSYIAESGRIAWTGGASGHNLTVDGQYPEVLLGPNHTIASGKVLDIRCGAQGAVGWDGTGTATLTIASGGTLRLRNYAGAYGARMSKLERFRSGALGDGETDPSVTVSLVLAAGSIVEVDTTGLTAGTYDLTGSGITVTNNGASLPAGVTVTGGKLVLTVS
ncbi:hypothetical protein [Paracoccus sp. 22332]|uniref:hypothetical protein n=1 Tax=Paracoccus sp. 22332 TaxID=3453913 RepID=UPI003F86FF23